MLQHSSPSLADVADLKPDQLERLTRSVDQKKQKLEDDINSYISRKQVELRNYEQQLLAEYRSMECDPPTRDADEKVAVSPSQTSAAKPTSNPTASQSPPAEASTDSKELGPGEAAKRTKHTRVHKREKELFGLVTPIFLPLLEAGESSPVKKKKEKKRPREEKAGPSGTSPPNLEQGSPSGTTEKGKESRRSKNKSREENMETGESTTATSESTKENHKHESGKRSKRALIKKSSLKHNGTPRTRRKRVSLVIDDQIVLPADSVAEPPLTSPSETTLSTPSNSSASLEDIIDPRLISPHGLQKHHDAVHHSLPLPTSLPSTLPTQHTGHTLSESPPTIDPHPQVDDQPSLDYEPPQTATRTFLDPSPPDADLIIPQYASASPIYASAPDLADQPEEEFSTYVGGLSGSGVDDVDQAGSYGYPSSLGASYLESYMKSRPLSVRIAAAGKAGLEEGEKKRLMSGDREREREKEREREREREKEREKERRRRIEQEDDDFGVGGMEDLDEGMEVIGNMEGF